MARIVAFVPDLLFGSRIVASLQAAGHDVQLVSELEDREVDADLVIVDLTAEADEHIAAAGASAGGLPKLAFYAHVEADVRTRAEQAGFDLVVPRSRMAREGPALVDRLLRGASG